MMIFKRISWKKALCLTLAVLLSAAAAVPAADASAYELKPGEGKVNIEKQIPEEQLPEEMTSEESQPTEEAAPEETEEPKQEMILPRMPAGILHDVPVYLQTDYPRVVYGSGTVANSGCSMTSIAMVISYLTGQDVYPDELAIRFREDDASNMQRMEAAALVHDLSFTKTFHWRDVVRGLTDGKIAIILVNSASAFTKTQHFMVLTGITDDGKIMVNDPYGPNYDRAELADGFIDGFDQSMLTRGFSGAWIFDDYVEPNPGPSRYPEITLTQDERNLLAKIIFLEARGESFEGQRAVAEVVFNRMMSSEFATNTLFGTIEAENQFRTLHLLDTAKPGELQFKAIDLALSGPYVLPKNVYFFATYPVNKNVWGRIGGHIFCGSSLKKNAQ